VLDRTVLYIAAAAAAVLPSVVTIEDDQDDTYFNPGNYSRADDTTDDDYGLFKLYPLSASESICQIDGIPVSTTGPITCDPFSVFNTQSATINTAPCTFPICPGDSVIVDMCGCAGDTYARLFSSDGVQRLQKDDVSGMADCSLCSSFTFSPSIIRADCEMYTLQQGCFENGECSGQTTISYGEATPLELLGAAILEGDSSSQSMLQLVRYMTQPSGTPVLNIFEY
jgi:hypothetical protein